MIKRWRRIFADPDIYAIRKAAIQNEKTASLPSSFRLSAGAVKSFWNVTKHSKSFNFLKPLNQSLWYFKNILATYTKGAADRLHAYSEGQ